MGRETNIEWCDSTINGSSGCDGCELWTGKVRSCYAGNLQENRLAKSLPDLYSTDFSEVRMIPGRFAKAAAWTDLRGSDRPGKPWLNGLPRTIFVGDMGDFLSTNVTDEYLKKELFEAINSKQGSRHFWFLLTKRPNRLARMSESMGGLPDNCMAMTTITNQRTAEIRVTDLLEVRCKWRGLSCEPLLGPLNLCYIRDDEGTKVDCLTGAEGLYDGGWSAPSEKRIHWVIVGGESGHTARPMHPAWSKSVRDQCAKPGTRTPFFFKQHGEWEPIPEWKPAERRPQGAVGLDGKWIRFDEVPEQVGAQRMLRVGKATAGRCLEGKEHNGYPSLQ